MIIEKIKNIDDDLAVSLSEAKTHLQVDYDDDDGYITDLINVATEYCENLKGSTFTAKQYRLSDFSTSNSITLYRLPLISIDSLKDSNDNLETDYQKEFIKDTLYLSSLKKNNELYTVEYTVGYSTVDDIPDRYKHAIKLCIGQLYNNREESTRGSLSKLGITINNLLGV